jgi:hypothetical protein
VPRGTDILSQELQDDFIVLSSILHILDAFSLRQENGLIGNLGIGLRTFRKWRMETLNRTEVVRHSSSNFSLLFVRPTITGISALRLKIAASKSGASFTASPVAWICPLE